MMKSRTLKKLPDQTPPEGFNGDEHQFKQFVAADRRSTLAGSGHASASDPDQSARFVEAARELGCDESEEAFMAVVKKVARHQPPSA